MNTHPDAMVRMVPSETAGAMKWSRSAGMNRNTTVWMLVASTHATNRTPRHRIGKNNKKIGKNSPNTKPDIDLLSSPVWHARTEPTKCPTTDPVKSP